MAVPKPPTWWDKLLWLFRITRRRQFVNKEFKITQTSTYSFSFDDEVEK